MDGAGRVSAHPDVTGAWHVVGAHCMFVIEMCQKTLSMAGNKLAELRRPQVPKRPRFSLPGACLLPLLPPIPLGGAGRWRWLPRAATQEMGSLLSPHRWGFH